MSGTITLDGNGRLVRFLSAVYSEPVGTTTGLNFCLLFWGVVLSPIVIFARLVTAGAIKGGRATGAIRAAAATGDRAAAFAQTHPTGTRWTGRVLGGLWGALMLFVWGYSLVRVAWWCPLALIGGGVLIGVLVWSISKTPVGGVLVTGYRAVKGRTCPRVVVR